MQSAQLIRNRLLKSFTGLAAMLVLSGCAALERMQMRPTEVYYIASTTERFAPKPPEFAIPVLDRPPSRSRVIGAYQFTTQNGRAFAIRSAVYNARRVGADAIWMRNLQEWAEPYIVPAHWETHQEIRRERRRIRMRGANGAPDQVREEVVEFPIDRPIWVPAQHLLHHFTSIDARMLRIQ